MRNRQAVILGIVIAVLMVTLTAQTTVAGEWTMMFNLDSGPNPATMTLQQDGDKLTGSITSAQGTFELEGTISDTTLEWVFEVDAGGTPIEVSVDGTVDGDGMSGSVDLGDFGGGDWTAKRIP